jgi:unsaturated rhamnogalacturonyl hydrolase
MILAALKKSGLQMTRAYLFFVAAILVAECGPATDPPFDYCTANRPPDLACYRSKRAPNSENIDLAKAIVDKQISDHPADTLDWDWEEAVLMVGVHELYRITSNEIYREYYQAWIDHHLDLGYQIVSSDSSAPARLALELYAYNEQARYRQVVDDFFYYLNHEALRTPEGGLNHLGTDDSLGITLWLDSLFMFGGVLIRWGEQTGDSDALNEFAFQYTVFGNLLQKESGWYKHSHNWLGTQDENVFWGRGNGWVAAATVDYLRVRLIRGEQDEPVQSAYTKLNAAIIRDQNSQSGLWWTVVNRPGETYLETSASALFAYSLARAYRYGFADESVLTSIASAVQGVKTMIQEDELDRPVVTGISGPTMVGTFAYYSQVPVLDDLPFGLGAVVLMLIETSGLP